MNEPKFFSEKQVGVAAVLGGPLSAGILFFLDYKRLGREKEAKTTLALTIFFTVALILTLIKLPEEILSKIPNSFFTPMYGAVFYFAFRKYLAVEINQKLTDVNFRASNWTVAGVIFLGLLLYVAIAFTFAFAEPAFDGDKLTFGKLKHEIFFNRDETTDEDVYILADELTKDGMFGDENQVAVRLETMNDRYNVTFQIQKDYWEDSEVISYMTDLKARLQDRLKKDVGIILEHYSLSGMTERKIL